MCIARVKRGTAQHDVFLMQQHLQQVDLAKHGGLHEHSTVAQHSMAHLA